MGWKLAVLTGCHDGALAPLSCASALIGSAAECDIVLTDPSIRATHAALALDPAGGLLHALAGAPVAMHIDAEAPADSRLDLRVLPWTPWALGAVWLALVPDDFAWHSTQPWPAAPASVQVTPPRRADHALALALGLALGVGLVAALAVLLPRPTVQSAAKAGAPASIEQRVRALGLADVQVAALPDRMQIDGWVASQAQFEQLIAALGSDGAAVRMNVRIGEEIARRAAEFIGPGVLARYDGGGRITLHSADAGAAAVGSVATSAATSAAHVAQRIERLRADLGPGVEIVSDVALPAPVAPPVIQPIPVRIVEVQADDPPHFRTSDGTRYFVGGRLPDGAEVVRIAADEIVFRHGERLIPYRLIN